MSQPRSIPMRTEDGIVYTTISRPYPLPPPFPTSSNSSAQRQGPSLPMASPPPSLKSPTKGSSSHGGVNMVSNASKEKLGPTGPSTANIIVSQEIGDEFLPSSPYHGVHPLSPSDKSFSATPPISPNSPEQQTLHSSFNGSNMYSQSSNIKHGNVTNMNNGAPSTPPSAVNLTSIKRIPLPTNMNDEPSQSNLPNSLFPDPKLLSTPERKPGNNINGPILASNGALLVPGGFNGKPVGPIPASIFTPPPLPPSSAIMLKGITPPIKSTISPNSAKNKYECSHPGCGKSYKCSAGMKYHLKKSPHSPAPVHLLPSPPKPQEAIGEKRPEPLRKDSEGKRRKSISQDVLDFFASIDKVEGEPSLSDEHLSADSHINEEQESEEEGELHDDEHFEDGADCPFTPEPPSTSNHNNHQNTDFSSSHPPSPAASPLVTRTPAPFSQPPSPAPQQQTLLPKPATPMNSENSEQLLARGRSSSHVSTSMLSPGSPGYHRRSYSQPTSPMFVDNNSTNGSLTSRPNPSAQPNKFFPPSPRAIGPTFHPATLPQEAFPHPQFSSPGSFKAPTPDSSPSKGVSDMHSSSLDGSSVNQGSSDSLSIGIDGGRSVPTSSSSSSKPAMSPFSPLMTIMDSPATLNPKVSTLPSLPQLGTSSSNSDLANHNTLETRSSNPSFFPRAPPPGITVPNFVIKPLSSKSRPSSSSKGRSPAKARKRSTSVDSHPSNNSLHDDSQTTFSIFGGSHPNLLDQSLTQAPIPSTQQHMQIDGSFFPPYSNMPFYSRPTYAGNVTTSRDGSQNPNITSTSTGNTLNNNSKPILSSRNVAADMVRGSIRPRIESSPYPSPRYVPPSYPAPSYGPSTAGILMPHQGDYHPRFGDLGHLFGGVLVRDEQSTSPLLSPITASSHSTPVSPSFMSHGNPWSELEHMPPLSDLSEELFQNFEELLQGSVDGFDMNNPHL